MVGAVPAIQRWSVMQHSQQMRPLSFSALTSATCAFTMCELEPHLECLIVGFEGEAGRGHEGTFDFMSAMIAASTTAWKVAAPVLDLTKLRYAWGDEMAFVLGGIQGPCAVVVSELNREGLRSIVKFELLDEPRESLFESMPDALAGVQQKLKKSKRQGAVWYRA